MKEMYLINAIMYEMEQLGNTDVEITNIRLFIDDNKRFALADVSYTWWLHGLGKRINRKNMIFALVDEKENR